MLTIRKARITGNIGAISQLEEFFASRLQNYDGYLYIGYPIFNIAGDKIVFDALWISETYGVVLFDATEEENLDSAAERRDTLYVKLESKLKGYADLVKGRELGVKIHVITFAPAFKKSFLQSFSSSPFVATSEKELEKEILGLDKWKFSELYDLTRSVIQSVVTLTVQNKRSNAKKENSKGSVLKKLERGLAILDESQEDAVISAIEWVHRIRGLAWSWKTVILALKAALLHAQEPDLDIAVTFNSRALKNQFKSLIERFCLSKTWEYPDWNKIQLIPAWWGPSSDGIYYRFCCQNWVQFLNVAEAQTRKYRLSLGDQNLIWIVSDKALQDLWDRAPKESFDVVLVDEAQDLSSSFLRLCYSMIRPERRTNSKRIVYAYDELQKLNKWASLPPPKEIFDCVNPQETMLDKCYRNSKETLTVAHALGFWFYRTPGWLVQFFNEPSLWGDVWYVKESGAFEAGKEIVLSRQADTGVREYLLDCPDEIISFHCFSNSHEQAEWIAHEIRKNKNEDELLEGDIIVINPIALTTKREVWAIRNMLNNVDEEFGWRIESHIAWMKDADVFFENNSIAFTWINRAKWNEVAMVYIMNAQECYDWDDLITLRNTLFTAITRSKWWVRVCGVGKKMEALSREFEKTKDLGYKLKFEYPSNDLIAKINTINRDLDRDDVGNKRTRKEVDILGAIKELERVKNWEKDLSDFSPEIQAVMRTFLNVEDNGG